MCLSVISAISIGNLRVGNLDFYSSNDIDSDFDESRFNTTEATIKKGDSFNKILQRQPISPEEKRDILSLISKSEKDIPLHIGKKIIFEYEAALETNPEDSNDVDEEGYQSLKQITYEIDANHRIEVIKNSKNIFILKNQNIPLNKVLVTSSKLIKGSLIDTLKQLDLPLNNILELINI